MAAADTSFYCPGHLVLGDTRFHCWKRGGHGSVDMVEAIAQSCDVYFYELAKRIGIERIEAMAKRLGQIGRAHVGTPVTNAQLVCRLLLEKKKKYTQPLTNKLKRLCRNPDTN